MTKLSFYKCSSIGLLALNLLLIGFFVFSKPGIRNKRKPMHEMLKLNETQENVFFNSAQNHRSSMRKADEELKTLLQQYFSRLNDSNAINDPDSLLNVIKNLEVQKIESTYDHLEEVKLLLSSEQEPAFDRFMEHIMHMILKSKNKKPNPPKD